MAPFVFMEQDHSITKLNYPPSTINLAFGRKIRTIRGLSRVGSFHLKCKGI